MKTECCSIPKLMVIAQNCGERYAILAVFSGLTLTLLVPVLVPALLALKC